MKQIEEMLVDEGFIAWASNQNSQQAFEWKQWMVEHPEQKSDVDDAVKLFKNLKLKEKDVEAFEIEFEKNRLLKAIDISKQPAKVITIKKYWWTVSAAACVLLMVGGVYVFNLLYGVKTEQTTYGEIAERVLPDGTSVLLNSNSSVKYAANWEKSNEREVWIKGEAFFHVTKKPDHKRFIVHTEQFDVIVTGTKFDVLNRNNSTTVMLKEGGVTVHFPNREDIKLKPGESVNLSKETTDISHIQPVVAKEENVLAWVNKKLYFENTNMLEVCEKIKELYGLDVELHTDSASLGAKTVTGILPNDNLDILIESLEATSNLKLVHKDNKLTVSLP